MGILRVGSYNLAGETSTADATRLNDQLAMLAKEELDVLALQEPRTGEATSWPRQSRRSACVPTWRPPRTMDATW
ncbi:hypothetical protein Misp01_76380 [Microtetraspora sp. NBRC 13810]|nr:hypothetical protein Misp01_76380 [Microtetraspora sp. NBRC 13810]